MIVEITGTNTRNKGAELMLIAVRAQLGEHSDVQLAVDQFFGTYAERAKHGLLQKIRLNGWGRSRIAVELMPQEFRRAFGLVRDDDVDALVDAAGFAFGDQHPPERAVQFAARVEAAKRSGKPVVLLPQALGPFENPAIRDAFVRIVDAADLVFARDDISMQHARKAAGARDYLRQAPDFTNLVCPELSVDSGDSDRVCIVPNQRMIEKAESEEEAAAYVPLLVRCVETVEDEGLQPILLLHERGDKELAVDVQQHIGHSIPLHEEQDPVALKRFLGESHLVIGSRFHSLVGALSQGVPSIGTSWSHKYEMLFRDYGCEEMLLPVPATDEQVRQRIQSATGNGRGELCRRIEAHSEALRAQTQSMWEAVFDVLPLQKDATQALYEQAETS